MFGKHRPVVQVPERVALDPTAHSKMLDVVMQEYTAIRREIDTTLANQVAILSFGAATVGLLVAAAASLWDREPLLTAALLLFVVPSACFLALAVHAGELVRLMRAGLFLHELEDWMNEAWSKTLDERRPLLTWEQWHIREGTADVDRHNLLAISAVFVTLAAGFAFSGFWRLHTTDAVDERLALLLLAVSLGLGLVTTLWVANLRAFAYRHRRAYTGQDGKVASAARPGEASA